VTPQQVRQVFAQAGIELVASLETRSGTVFLRPRRSNASSVGLLVVVAGRRSQVATVLREPPLPGSTRTVQFLQLHAGNVWVRGAIWRATGSPAPVLRAVAALRRLQQPAR
jgi:hypothetical protein